MLLKENLIRLIIGFIGGVILLYIFIPNNNPIQFEDLALGKETVSVYNLVDGKKVHCNDMSNLKDCILAYENLGLDQSVILWLGNSQVHAINQPKPKDETAASDLHRKFQLNDKYFLTYSQPNANLQEHYILLAQSITNLPITTLVLPIVFDDMREDGIRTKLLPIFENTKAVQLLTQGDLGIQLYTNYKNQNHTKNDLTGLSDTVQERVELLLNQKLSETWPIWDSRRSYRGMFLSFLFTFRNWILGISPSSTRKMIPGRYSKNLQAFSETLDLAAKNQIEVLVYIVPIRDDVTIPYDLDQYKAFKSEVKNITLQKGFYFSNFEKIIPSKLWGFKNSTTLGGDPELDFMHFKAEGHRILAETIYEKLIEFSTE